LEYYCPASENSHRPREDGKMNDQRWSNRLTLSEIVVKQTWFCVCEWTQDSRLPKRERYSGHCWTSLSSSLMQTRKYNHYRTHWEVQVMVICYNKIIIYSSVCLVTTFFFTILYVIKLKAAFITCQYSTLKVDSEARIINPAETAMVPISRPRTDDRLGEPGACSLQDVYRAPLGEPSTSGLRVRRANHYTMRSVTIVI
jgi:hypothetical protein